MPTLITRRLALLVPLVLAVSSLAWGQFRSAGDNVEAHLARDDSFDGKFHYCRAVYRQNPRGQGGSWLTDYPLADIDLSIRLSELTKIRVSFDGTGRPSHLIVQLTSDELFRCPIILMQEVGQAVLHRRGRRPAARLPAEGRLPLGGRLLGFVRVGGVGDEIRKVFPPPDYHIVDLPPDHPIYHTMFDLEGVPQIPGIGTFLAAGHVGARRRQRRGARRAASPTATAA